ncbi:MAG: tRNA-dihydrouridine synthase [Neisseria sp.]|nr:tRNA-dihydrouridine synthase [Neisseria sp.]
MKIILAPMHGYADSVMRHLLSTVGGFDEVVSEFVRITHTLHSPKTWLKNVPELAQGAATSAGTPCTVQLLGSDAEKMAENAVLAVQCGAKKIDLNFGCPAPTVNQHQGGAVLLQTPHRLEAIVRAVRIALPDPIELSAKMRLGFDHTDLAIDCARAIAVGGAQSLTVHARTKIQAYAPSAQWQWFAPLQAAIDIPLIANGDIFSLQDFIRLQTYCTPAGIMLGRGALMRPDLARQIQAYLHGQEVIAYAEAELLSVIRQFFDLCCAHDPHGQYAPSRLKQWLPLLCEAHPFFAALLQQIRPCRTIEEVTAVLNIFQAA